MEFSEEQKDTIRGWAREGCGLAEIQRRIAGEFGTTMTYMDVRFLIVDLDVTIDEPEEKKPAPPAPPEEPPPPPAEPPAGPYADAPPAEPYAEAAPAAPPSGAEMASHVSVEIDRLIKPGAIVSGTVTFSDGVTATWMLDQLGRLAIDPSQPGYRPSDADNEAFVKALQAEVAKQGF